MSPTPTATRDNRQYRSALAEVDVQKEHLRKLKGELAGSTDEQRRRKLEAQIRITEGTLDGLRDEGLELAKKLELHRRGITAGDPGNGPRSDGQPLDANVPGEWLSRVIRREGGGGAMAIAQPLTTDGYGSVDATDRLFFRVLASRSALLNSNIQTVDIETSSIEVGCVTGDMTPAVPTAETDPIAKSDVPLEDREITPPKFPVLVGMSTEAFNDARPLRVAAVEKKIVQAIGVGFDAAGFHGADKSLHPGLANIPGVGKVAVDEADLAYDWCADSAGSILEVNGQAGLLFASPFTITGLLKLKDKEDRYRIADLQAAASSLMGVPVMVTKGVNDGEAFMVDPSVLVIIRRQDVQTEVFEGYDVEHALVGVRTMMRAQLVTVDPRGVVHITGLPVPGGE